VESPKRERRVLSPLARGAGGVCMKIHYDPKLKEIARKLRNNSTKAEIRLWHYLKGKQLYGYDFHRQKPIGEHIVDFFCHKLMLAIEVDGYTHDFKQTFAKDALKTQALNDIGIKILRFSDEEVFNNIEGVIETIKDYILTVENKHTP
jgi:very-short-patch-repair endonuclease